MAGASPGPVFPRLSGFFKADRNVRFEKPDSHAELIVPVDIGGWPIEINRRCESVKATPKQYLPTHRGFASLWEWCVSVFFKESIMDREEVNGFLRFLEQASVQEIEKAKEEMKALLAQVDGNAAADVRFCLRLVDRELVARADLFRLQARR